MENVFTSVLFAKSASKYAQNPTDKAKKLIEFVGLGADKLDVPAKNLNVVELRRVQLARALATNPKLLLLDELLTGLTPKECDEAIALVKLVNKQGASVLMVEHIMKVVMGLCNRVVVLHHGEKICEGPPEKVCADKNVINVYLGKKFLFDEE
jgi:branched-chain amino acid transport system ATP-binding protein